MAHSFESQRLVFRQIESNDWDFFQRLYLDSNVMGYVSDIESEVAIRNKFESRLSKWSNKSEHWLSILIADKGCTSPVGIIGLKPNIENDEFELGYILSKDSWGKGYASESVEAMLKYSNQFLKISGFKAVVSEGNLASEKVLEKCGFEKTEILRNAISLKGKWHDDYVFKYHT